MNTIAFPKRDFIPAPTPEILPSSRAESAKILRFPGAFSPAAASTLLLLGSPGVGKSRLFARLTNRKTEVSEVPGATVEVTRGRAAHSSRVDVVDLPGITDLSSPAVQARVALRLLRKNPGTTVVQVADAKNLGDALPLTFQLAELGCPMVLALNRMDELTARGGRIEVQRLSEILGIPVVRTVAAHNRGTATLIDALEEARPAYVLAPVWDSTGGAGRRDRDRLARVKQILAEVYTVKPARKASLRARLGSWAKQPFQGFGVLPLLLGIMQGASPTAASGEQVEGPKGQQGLQRRQRRQGCRRR